MQCCCTMFIVDGQWGSWDEWSECSHSCGGGRKIRSRRCDNPSPLYNGKDCVGPGSELSLCNSEKCPGNMI